MGGGSYAESKCGGVGACTCILKVRVEGWGDLYIESKGGGVGTYILKVRVEGWGLIC